MSTLTAIHSYYGHNLEQKTPKRYFTLGVLCCCISGFVFFIGIILMVFGSSPAHPEAIWITGIVFLLTGGLLFFLGVSSIGLYLSKEDKRKRDLELARTRHYASSDIRVRFDDDSGSESDLGSAGIPGLGGGGTVPVVVVVPHQSCCGCSASPSASAINTGRTTGLDCGPNASITSNWVLGVRHQSLSSHSLNDIMAKRGKQSSHAFKSNANHGFLQKRVDTQLSLKYPMDDIEEEVSQQSFHTFHSHHNSVNNNKISAPVVQRQKHTMKDKSNPTDRDVNPEKCDKKSIRDHQSIDAFNTNANKTKVFVSGNHQLIATKTGDNGCRANDTDSGPKRSKSDKNNIILFTITPFLLIPIWVIPNPYSPLIRNVLWLSLLTSVLLMTLAALTGNVYWYYDQRSQKWKWFYHCGKGPEDHYWGATLLHNHRPQKPINCNKKVRPNAIAINV
ncbi:unnamed protein product [Oppiella nova]|uniref:Uncharacterized protein n=1 Tax=Oppiella nova TaxID=334625 RepID=A0A7R9LR67_9ACAR|nr:unnamed protein product [Oppiella nova]CAG2166158.1 unnamed protein product [Oppiella nova]